MFFLSPLLWLSRKLRPRPVGEEAILKAFESEHKVPTSIPGVFEKQPSSANAIDE
jgi:hypothetical protein